MCLVAEHAQSALKEAGCVHCDSYTVKKLRSCLAFLREKVTVSCGRLRSWGSQVELVEAFETGASLSLISTCSSKALSLDPKACIWLVLSLVLHQIIQMSRVCVSIYM